MKKNYLKLISSFIVYLLVITGCQKVIQDQPLNAEINSQFRTGHDGNKNECRLVFSTNTDPTYSQDWHFHYNDKGLVDKWDIENYGLFTQEYDANGKLIKSIHSIEGEVIFTIHFFYQGNKVVKNIYYYGTGTDIMDEMYYTYDAQGRMVKAQSFVNDHISITKYSPEGNMLSNELSFGGAPVYSQFFKHDKQYKNPLLLVTGVEYNFGYYSPASPFYSKWRYASVKEVAYDENGNPVTVFEFDPSQTVWQSGPKNYPASVTYYDLSGASWPYRFEFENCGPNSNSNSSITPPSPLGARKINPLTLLQRNPAKSMKEQVKEFRQQLRHFKN